jgi:hypothetical protein
MRSFSLIVSLSIILVITTLSCHKDSYTLNKADLFKKWTLVYVQKTRTPQLIIYPDTTELKETITFTDTALLINGSCGNYGQAYYSIKNDSIAFTKFRIWGLLFCDLYDWETYVLNNLDSAYFCTVNSNMLRIYSRGSYDLTFFAIPSK